MRSFILSLFFCSVCFNSKAQNITNSGLADFKAKCISVQKTYPTNQKIEQSTKLTAKGKEVFKKLSSIIDRGSKISNNTTIETFMRIMDDLESVMKVLDPGSEDVKGGQPGTVAMKKGQILGRPAPGFLVTTEEEKPLALNSVGRYTIIVWPQIVVPGMAGFVFAVWVAHWHMQPV